jgi:hypothetical protein
MHTRPILMVALTSILTAAGCHTAGHGEPGNVAALVAPKAAASPATKAAFDKLAAMAGTWEVTVKEMEGVKGTSVLSVSSMGSVVREIMGPGAEHEMTNVYHLDGPDLVMTHYCGAGNQPHMVATVDGNTIRFKLQSITNVRKPDESVMAAVDMTFDGPDHVIQAWTHFKSGVPSGNVTMDMKRVKK